MTTRREKFLGEMAETLRERAERETDPTERAKLERAAKWYVDALLRGWR